MRVVIKPAAEADLADAIGWYEANSFGLSFDLRLALLATLDQVCRYPHSSTQVSTMVRRALLHRFPHAVYYRLCGDTIEVIAILHTHSSPRRWQQRQ
jgi:plasmid stabilization system protein ParE